MYNLPKPGFFQSQSHTLIISNSVGVLGKQLLLCTLHQYAPNGLFYQLFIEDINARETNLIPLLFEILSDFPLLTVLCPLVYLLQDTNQKNLITTVELNTLLLNLSSYLKMLSVSDTSSLTWKTQLLALFDEFFSKLFTWIDPKIDIDPIFSIMITLIKVTNFINCKGLSTTFSKMLSYACNNHSINFDLLQNVCTTYCTHVFAKDKDKQIFANTLINELLQVIKTAKNLYDINALLIIQLVLLDCGGTLGPLYAFKTKHNITLDPDNFISSGTAIYMKACMSDLVHSLCDTSLILKIRTNIVKTGEKNVVSEKESAAMTHIQFDSSVPGANLDAAALNQSRTNSVNAVFRPCMHEDTLGYLIKGGIAQFIAIHLNKEITSIAENLNENSKNANSDNTKLLNMLPWLAPLDRYNTKTWLDKNESKESYGDNVDRVRILSWILLASLQHCALTKSASCLPLNLSFSSHVADMFLQIVNTFTENNKSSATQNTSYLHLGFLLCQLWTVYCEYCDVANSHTSGGFLQSNSIIVHFWSQTIPAILHMISSSESDAEMMTLYIINIMESLQEINSTSLIKLLPLWKPILTCHQFVPLHLLSRFNQILENVPEMQLGHGYIFYKPVFLQWLSKLQVKLRYSETNSSIVNQMYAL